MAPSSPALPARLAEFARNGDPLAHGARSLRVLLREGGLDTVCQEARCPNQHAPVRRDVPPSGLDALAEQARALGAPTVYAGVFVRSSFNAEEVFHARGGACDRSPGSGD